MCWGWRWRVRLQPIVQGFLIPNKELLRVACLPLINVLIIWKGFISGTRMGRCAGAGGGGSSRKMLERRYWSFIIQFLRKTLTSFLRGWNLGMFELIKNSV